MENIIVIWLITIVGLAFIGGIFRWAVVSARKDMKEEIQKLEKKLESERARWMRG